MLKTHALKPKTKVYTKVTPTLVRNPVTSWLPIFAAQRENILHMLQGNRETSREYCELWYE